MKDKFNCHLLNANNFLFGYLPFLCSLLIFSLYFYQIGYFPISSFENLLTLALFVGFASIAILIFLCIPLWISSYLQNKLIDNHEVCSLIFKPKFHTVFSKIIKKKKRKKTELAVLAWLFKKIFLYHVACFALMLPVYFLPILYVAFICFPLLYIVLDSFISSRNNAKRAIKSKYILVLYIIAAIVTSNTCLIFTTGLLRKLNDNDSLINVVVTYLALLSYSIFTLTPVQGIKISKLWRPITLFFIVIFLLLIDGSFFKMPGLIIHECHIAMADVTISTDNVGCILFKKKGYRADCKKNEHVYLLPHIDILWRAGDEELFLKFKDTKGNIHHLLSTRNMKIYDIDSDHYSQGL